METLRNNIATIVNTILTNSNISLELLTNDNTKIKNLISVIVKYIKDDYSVRLHKPTRLETEQYEYIHSHLQINIYYNIEKVMISLNIEEIAYKSYKINALNIFENYEDVLDIESLF